jgi:hypothetical protein
MNALTQQTEERTTQTIHTEKMDCSQKQLKKEKIGTTRDEILSLPQNITSKLHILPPVLPKKKKNCCHLFRCAPSLNRDPQFAI